MKVSLSLACAGYDLDNFNLGRAGGRYAFQALRDGFGETDLH
ncbi:hypothetical protein CEV34_2699 [Brucella pseudogrignonensis]|uniref:Uncharacterized protein n=1 Tax=Brucella pseudogrignonensis TaxID=419475 RepID=A0A256GGT0_9HYPH|nr:hypothetical protein CEV34_2699 [Brucella pseudogrignonensis]